MKLTEEEINDFNNSTDNFMGCEWGKNEYGESEEVKETLTCWNDEPVWIIASIIQLLEALAEENAPFFKLISKRWDFLMSYPTTGLVLHFFNSVCSKKDTHLSEKKSGEISMIFVVKTYVFRKAKKSSEPFFVRIIAKL